MKPLGFSLDQMGDLLEATDRLDGEEPLGPGTRKELLERVRGYERAAVDSVADLRVALARAEDFAVTLRSRLDAAHQAPGPPRILTGHGA